MLPPLDQLSCIRRKWLTVIILLQGLTPQQPAWCHSSSPWLSGLTQELPGCPLLCSLIPQSPGPISLE